MSAESVLHSNERPGAASESRPGPEGATGYSLILETGSRAVFHTILVFSLFMFFSGHNAPGGGFIAGLIAGGALIIRYLATGPADFDNLVRVRPETVLGLGVVVSAGYGAFSALFGEAFESQHLALSLPGVGKVSLTSSLVFDVGVYLVVVGLVMTVLRNLGSEPRK